MVMKMKKIERGLKNSAKRMFDDAAVKECIRAELCGNRVFEEVAEPVAIAGGRTVRTGTDFDAKKKITLITALVLIACLAVSLTCYFMLARGIAPLSDTYIALDINPSFGITAGEDDIVTEVTALNEDAAVVLYGMELAGLTVDEAVTKIVAECELLGYLEAEDGETRILAVNSNSAKESAVANGVVSALGNLFRENAWGASVRNIACANPSCTGHCDTDAACIAANQAAAFGVRYPSGILLRIGQSYDVVVFIDTKEEGSTSCICKALMLLSFLTFRVCLKSHTVASAINVLII